MALQILYDELTEEILSWLPVKSLVRFKCVSKSFQSFICDPRFVKLHLHRSPRNANFLTRYKFLNGDFALPSSFRSLSEGPSLQPRISLETYRVIGSCNGLVCLVDDYCALPICIYKFLLWNPSIRKTFEVPQCTFAFNPENNCFFFEEYGFGYDNLSDAYKVVMTFNCCQILEGREHHRFSEVKICNISDNNCWRSIQSFPVNLNKDESCGVYINNTLNWMTKSHAYEWVIASLDLGNEACKQFLLPLVVGRVPLVRLLHLKDCLSIFFSNHETNYISIWQMKEFGNQKSWSPLLNLSIHQDLQINHQFRHFLEPLCVLENDRVLMIDTTTHPKQAILYDGRDKSVKRSKLPRNLLRVYAMDFVQSLVSPGTY